MIKKDIILNILSIIIIISIIIYIIWYNINTFFNLILNKRQLIFNCYFFFFRTVVHLVQTNL